MARARPKKWTHDLLQKETKLVRETILESMGRMKDKWTQKSFIKAKSSGKPLQRITLESKTSEDITLLLLFDLAYNRRPSLHTTVNLGGFDASANHALESKSNFDIATRKNANAAEAVAHLKSGLRYIKYIEAAYKQLRAAAAATKRKMHYRGGPSFMLLKSKPYEREMFVTLTRKNIKIWLMEGYSPTGAPEWFPVGESPEKIVDYLLKDATEGFKENRDSRVSKLYDKIDTLRGQIGDFQAKIRTIRAEQPPSQLGANLTEASPNPIQNNTRFLELE